MKHLQRVRVNVNTISVRPGFHSNQNDPGVQLLLVYLRAETGQAQEQNTGSNRHSQPVRVKRKHKRDKAGGKHGKQLAGNALGFLSYFSDQLKFYISEGEKKNKHKTPPQLVALFLSYSLLFKILTLYKFTTEFCSKLYKNEQRRNVKVHWVIQRKRQRIARDSS